MTTVNKYPKVPRLKCLLCKRWKDEYSSKYNYNEYFRIRKGSRMEKWIERFNYCTITEPEDERFVCEMHFNRLDILRIAPSSKPLKVALLTDRSVLPVYFNQVSVRKWNTIDFKDVQTHYKRCLSSYYWDFDWSEQKLVMKCRRNKNEIHLMLSLIVHIFCNRQAVEVNLSPIFQNYLEGRKIKYWSRLRGLMRYCESHANLLKNVI